MVELLNELFGRFDEASEVSYTLLLNYILFPKSLPQNFSSF